ncbi:MAG: hypothetical protein ACFE7E_09245 [Candidatus Hodarchaeota archaeon]
MKIDEELINQTVLEYITKVNSNWHSNVFTSARLAKITLERLGDKSTRFPIIHSIIRKTLQNLAERGFCTYMTTTKLGRCRKTKDVYKFNPSGIRWIKQRIIEQSIKGISRGRQFNHGILRTREMTINALLTEMAKSIE